MDESARVPLSKSQLEIMEIVWERGEVTVSDIWDVLSERREIARNTVQTLMVRMEEKGWIGHRAIGRTFLYSPVESRQVTLGSAVRDLLETLFQGSAEDLVTALLEDRNLTKDEADRIRARIDRAERGQRRRKR